MFGSNPSDRGPINAGWLTFATQLADSFSPGTAARQPMVRRFVWLQRLVAWGARPLASGPHSATDACTRLEITALGGQGR